ncbi:hypothetical protein LWI28_009056 [Acer negundo]|uniref:Cation/H+ exchanger domain-containing protein n=1 Tax=Acer negundo TaxID=4023 RepID=A0AAD5P161_ACENE|nr:hypothetical protein LWI28_009056 [Acer negundo]KAK4854713.1 hypothetical protein QYF36_000378 [Acer negundo]
MENQIIGRYNISNPQGYEITVCYMQNVSVGSSHWQTENPAFLHLPLLTLQLAIMIFVSRILMFVFRPLRQPRFVAEVIAGILLGPSYFGNIGIANNVFPFESTLLLETFANFGLIYYMFLVGLEMDLSAVTHMSKKSLSIATATILISLGAGAGLYFVPVHKKTEATPLSLKPLGAVFWAITLSITSFPELARILSEFKLLHTDLGSIALTTSIASDMFTLCLLVVAIVTLDDHNILAAAIPTLIFLTICWYVFRPAIAWMIRRTKEKGDQFDEMHIYFILGAVATCGLITDACGSHSMIGGFMLGLIIPKGELAIKILESIDEFVKGIMLPAFFMLNGIRTDLYGLPNVAHLAYAWLITIAATFVKIGITIAMSLYSGMSFRDGLALGGLMNTKGVIALIVLNEGRALKILDNTTMTVMSTTVLFMTALVGPIVFLANKTIRSARKYKQRTIQRNNPDTELRILTCIHSIGNLSGIINLLEVSNSTQKSPIKVFAVHLVELIGRASAMLVVQEAGKNNSAIINYPSREWVESDHIFSAFERYKERHETVTVHPLTVVSPYVTMHEDIYQFAEDKLAAMILIPFHKQGTITGGLQGSENQYSNREVNQNLLLKSPCSVGILVDRGLRLSKPLEPSSQPPTDLRIAMLFISGLDDHEALSYAHRIAGTPGVTLTVVRFLPIKMDKANGECHEEERSCLTTTEESEAEKELDDDYINEFRFKTMFDDSITYLEKQLNNGVELVKDIKTKYNDFDLYVVGRGVEAKSPLIMGISELIDHPELGPIGDVLLSSAFTAHASVLVVQQPTCDGFRTKGNFRQKKWASPVLNPDYDLRSL